MDDATYWKSRAQKAEETLESVRHNTIGALEGVSRAFKLILSDPVRRLYVSEASEKEMRDIIAANATVVERFKAKSEEYLSLAGKP